MILHALVKGRVQGVGFRYWLYDQARQLGITGYVRNLPDGNVEVRAEGDDHQLHQVEQLLWKGPLFASVDDVDVNHSDEPARFEEFEIRR
jgi:acylphosphatase